jgi:monofunctional biosynthetic peptidoglycan transglycosylase
MKAIRLKLFLSTLPFLLILIILLSLYFSHDVSLLQTLYPAVEVSADKVTYHLEAKAPSYWVRLKDISPYAKGAIIVTEDWSFYEHEGVDFEQLKDALGDINTGKRLRGASTITQQMVKNVLLNSDRSLWRKLHELILARKVEHHLDKKRILEIYLNSIQYGPHHFGIRSAANYYFGKHPRALTPRESAFLAMLLPSPTKYSVSFRRKRLTPFARTRIEEILIKMRMGKIITPAMYQSERDQKFSWESL